MAEVKQADISGVDSEKMNLLILDIYDYAESIKTEFNEFEELIESVNTFYKCDNADKLKKRLDDLKDNFEIVNKNILSYTTELSNAKRSYSNFVSQEAASFGKGSKYS